jgi:hypothetical protein
MRFSKGEVIADDRGAIGEIIGITTSVDFPYSVREVGGGTGAYRDYPGLRLADTEPVKSDPYTGTYLELEDLARQINLYQGYADEAEQRRTEAIEKESRNIDFELDRVRKCQDRLRVLLRELGLVSGEPAVAAPTTNPTPEQETK